MHTAIRIVHIEEGLAHRVRRPDGIEKVGELCVGDGQAVDFKVSIWQRKVDKAGVVTLGGVNPPELGARSAGFNMYGVAAVATD